ncbi:MAG TPA: type II toxin-antitoxin system HicB family antitoxin [Ktedonobacteraceae bacterium]|nr:type II toxin-antitoxin system HicB family antitoxin [Ktedonobacteraceae bacterium]
MGSEHIYQILLTWSEQQRAVVAEVPELPTCTATGATYEIALAAIQEAVHRWIEVTQRAGHGLPERQKRPLVEEREQLVVRATAEGRQAAVESIEGHTLLDETSLQVYAAQQMDALLTMEPIETDNTAALSKALWEAYMAGYREAAHERGWEIQS